MTSSSCKEQRLLSHQQGALQKEMHQCFMARTCLPIVYHCSLVAPFIRCEEYWVKEVAFKKKGAKTDTIYFGIEYILLYAYIVCPHPSTQLHLISPLTSLWPSPTLVPTLPCCLLWLLHGSRQNKPPKTGVQTHVGNASYHLCKVCERRNSASEVIDSVTFPGLVKSVFFKKHVLKSLRQPQKRSSMAVSMVLGQTRWF